MQNGAIFSIAAAGFYFVDSIIVCSTPKPTPWCQRAKAEDDDTGCIACCAKKKPVEDVSEKNVPQQDNNVELAVAAGAAAGAAAAVGVMSMEGDDDAVVAAGGDEETGDADSEVDSAAASEPSQAGEEITLELSQSMQE